MDISGRKPRDRKVVPTKERRGVSALGIDKTEISQRETGKRRGKESASAESFDLEDV